MAKAKKKLNVKSIAVVALLVVAAAGGFLLLRGEEVNYYDFTACMAEKKLIEIGSDTCLHCENEKRILGHEAFKQYDDAGMYLRCNKDPVFCSQLGIRGTPTWYMPSPTGKQINAQGSLFQISGTYDEYLGELSISKLSEITGCPIPENYDPSKAPKAGGFTES